MSSIPSLPSNFDSFNPSRDIGLFNPSLSCPDSEARQFNDVTSFLRNLEHCQGLYRYRRTKLLEYMLWALNGPAWEWFKKRSHFNSLPRFGMALTEAFPSQEQRELESIAQKRAKRKARKTAERAELNAIETAKQTPTLQDLGIFDPSLASDRPEFGLYSNAATFLQHLEQCQHLHRKSDLLNLLPKCLCGHASEWFKTQSEFTSLKRFSRALTKAFPKASIRRALPSGSNLQLSTLDVIPESRENASGQQVVQVNCKICKQSFNSNNELYEHIRNHEALKPAKDSHLLVNAVNLVCEIEEKPSATHVSPVLLARPQKSIVESAVTSEAVTLLKRSTLQPPALETTQEPTERSATCRHCKQTFNSKKMLRQHKSEQHAKRPAVSSHLSIDAAKSACESGEISTVNSSPSASLAVQPDTLPLPASLGTFNPNRPHQDLEKRRFNQATTFIQHLQQCQHLCCESELLEWMEVILCGPADTWFGNQPNFTSLHDFGIALTKAFPTPTSSTMFISPLPIPAAKSVYETKEEPTVITATCRHCDEIFNSRKSLRKHKSEQHPKKHVKNSCLEDNAANLVCAVEEKPAVMNLPASPELQATTTTPKQKFESAITSGAVTSSKGSHLSSIVPEIVPEPKENKSTQYSSASPEPSPRTFESKHQETEVQKRSTTCSPLSNNTANSTCEAAEKPTTTSTAEVSELTPEQSAEWRSRTAYLSTRLKASRLDLPLNTFITIPERVENASIQGVTCARATCRSCDQNFNSNEKLFEHIREHEALKRTNKVKSTCKAANKSAIACLPHPQKPPSPTESTSVQRICRQCKQSFNSNNKLHEHIRQHHARKPVKSLNLRVPTPEPTYETKKKPAFTCPLASLAPPTPPATPVRKHQEPHIQKSYLTVEDLSRMFAGKPRPLGLQQHHNRRPSQQGSGIRQSRSVKPYLTIGNLFEMFDGKSRRRGLFQGQNNVSSQASSGQMQITAYFKPTANQKPPIGQASKGSKPKTSKQHMPAESIRTASSKTLPEKSTKSPYKLPHVSGETPSFISILLRLLPAFLLALAFVSAVSAARMGCISVYQQAISAIGRANIGFIASRRS